MLNRKIVAISLVICVFIIAMSGCGSSAVTGDSSGNDASSPAQSSSASSIVSSSASSSSEKESSDITLGEFNGNLYTNESLGVTMEIPDGWYPLNEEQRLAIMQAGMEIMAGDDKTKQAMLDLSAQKTLSLLCAYEKDPLTTTDTNANIQLSAEKIGLLASAFVKGPDDYITAVKAQLEAVTDIQGIKVAYTYGNTEDAVLDGKDFRMLPTQLELADGKVVVKQDYYVYFKKDYAFVAILTYFDDEQGELTKASLETIKLA